MSKSLPSISQNPSTNVTTSKKNTVHHTCRPRAAAATPLRGTRNYGNRCTQDATHWQHERTSGPQSGSGPGPLFEARHAAAVLHEPPQAVRRGPVPRVRLHRLPVQPLRRAELRGALPARRRRRRRRPRLVTRARPLPRLPRRRPSRSPPVLARLGRRPPSPAQLRAWGPYSRFIVQPRLRLWIIRKGSAQHGSN